MSAPSLHIQSTDSMINIASAMQYEVYSYEQMVSLGADIKTILFAQ